MKDNYYKSRYKLPEHWMLDDTVSWGLEYINYMKLIKQEVRSIQNKKGKHLKVLDIGCGDGRLSGELTDMGCDITGQDYSDMGIGYSRLLVPSGNFYITDFTEENEYMKHKHKFDVILSVGFIEYVPETWTNNILWYISDNLAENGILIMITITEKSPPLEWKRHYVRFNKNSIQKRFEINGLEITKITGICKDSWIWWFYHNQLLRFVRNKYYDIIFMRKLFKLYYKSRLAVCKLNDARRFYVIAKKGK